MNEAQEAKAKKISELLKDFEECCRTISNLNFMSKHAGSIVIKQPFHETSTANIDFDAKQAILTGAIYELNHLRETIEVKLSNELGESCKQ